MQEVILGLANSNKGKKSFKLSCIIATNCYIQGGYSRSSSRCDCWFCVKSYTGLSFFYIELNEHL